MLDKSTEVKNLKRLLCTEKDGRVVLKPLRHIQETGRAFRKEHPHALVFPQKKPKRKKK